MSRTILVTGATGAVSSQLIQTLRASQGEQRLRALVRSEQKAAPLVASGVDVTIADLDEPESLPRAFEGVDDLWLLTPPGPRAPENNMNAMWAARNAGVKRVVRMSAIGAAHDAPTRNGRLHALSDQELQASGLRWTILRPHFFMQNLLAFAPGVAADGNFYLNTAHGRLGMVDTRDVAAVAAAILLDDSKRHDGQIYTPTGPQSLDLTEVAEGLARVLDRPLRFVSVPDEAVRAGSIQAGLTPWLAGMMVEYGRAYAANWGNFTTTHVKDTTGRQPRSLADFAREQWPR
ncbi:MAG TPA: SDR family oxidoreductase [Polyangiaceae bacterium]|nr:SDR family oxidoreductase [Polyangiaceae bacterium]